MSFERVAEIEKSLIRKMFEKANDKSINLGIGMPFCQTAESVKNYAIEAIKNDKTFYTPNQGVKELRKEVAKKNSDELSLELDSENVLITNGATQAIFTLMFSLLNPGDEVLIPDPGYPLYETIAKMLKCNIKKYSLLLENDFDLNVDEISQKVSTKTVLIVLNSPNNPTGMVINKRSLKAIASLVKNENMYVLSDEIYRGLNYEEPIPSISSFLPLERLFVVSGVSKEFSMTGWRIGWIISSKYNISQILKAHMHVISCISEINQLAAAAALKLRVQNIRDIMKFNRDFAVGKLSKIPSIKYKVPKGGLYIFINVSAYGGGEKIANLLLENENVITIPGIAFGERGRDFIRISFGADLKSLERGLKSIERFFSHVII